LSPVAAAVILLSNVNGYEKNGLGYLSMASPDGTGVTTRWVTGLNGPTGMAIRGDSLYVADIDELVAIDLPSGRIARRYPAPERQPGLNDVAVGPDGAIYVSASARGAVYRLRADELETWVRDERLKDANGLLAHSSGLLVARWTLHRINLDGEPVIEPFGDQDVTDLETVEEVGADRWLVTTVGANRILELEPSGRMRPVLERETYSADIEYIPAERLLLVPSGENRLVAFRVVLTRTSARTSDRCAWPGVQEGSRTPGRAAG